MQMYFGKPAAAAELAGEGGLKGRIELIPQRGGTLVVAKVWGLPESEAGFFALHIHEGNSCAGAGHPLTGDHYNPERAAHPRHAGDLPPLLSSGGRAFMAVLTGRFRVEDVIGRTVVIHSGPDDFRTQPSGGAGSKIACGVIKRATQGR